MSQFDPGKLINLSRLVHRVVAPNGGMMTGPGTNTYLVGNRELLVIDPGPDDESHINAIVQAAAELQGTIRWIFCTHTHPDHSPGCPRLKARTNGTVYGQKPPEKGFSQDHGFEPDHSWCDMETLKTTEFTMRAVYTPGHASNHWCYLLEDENLLFTGDHIINGSTVVIARPDGSMQAYLDSLEKLKPLAIDHLAPGHGDIMNNPKEVIEGTIQHRLMRETKTLEKLSALHSADLDQLVAEVYDEVPVFLHALAKHSLESHLVKLVDDGKILKNDNRWSIAS